jgi:hypothetical protein
MVNLSGDEKKLTERIPASTFFLNLGDMDGMEKSMEKQQQEAPVTLFLHGTP